MKRASIIVIGLILAVALSSCGKAKSDLSDYQGEPTDYPIFMMFSAPT